MRLALDAPFQLGETSWAFIDRLFIFEIQNNLRKYQVFVWRMIGIADKVAVLEMNAGCDLNLKNEY
jgi:hypothetical protein